MRYILIVLTATALFPAIATAQDDARKTDVETLRAKLYFVGRLAAKYPVSGFADTYGNLEQDIRDALQRHGGGEDLHSLRRETLLSWGNHHREHGNDERALEPYERLLEDYSVEDEAVREAARAAAGIYLAKAEAAESDEAKLAAFRRAGHYYEKVGDAEATRGIRNRTIDLRGREGIRLAEQKKFGEAYVLLTGLETELGEPLGDDNDAGRALARIQRETGNLSVALDAVDAKGLEVREGAGFRLLLTSRNGGESTETEYSRKPFRWLLGRYDVSLVLPDEKAPAVTLPVDLVTTGAEVRFPGTFPAGMVYVPAGGGVERPFFMDRFEVSIQQFKGFDSSYRPPTSGAGGEVAAHGINYRQASAYARSVGKKLPTEAQWLWAAFRGKSQKYPWGNAAPTKEHCRIGTRTEGPGAVGDCAAGASEFGVLNMAGNVWEWLRDEFAIGGGYRNGFLQYDVGYQKGGRQTSWKADFLRHKKPSGRVYLESDIWSDSASPLYRQQSKYRGYQVSDSNLEEVGIRCVIEL